MKKRTLSVVLSLVLAIVFTFTLAGCNTGADEIKLDKTELNLSVGEEYTLTATCDPESAAKNLTWESADTSVATITDGGTVKGVGCGSTTVWAKAKNGVQGYCNVTVKEVWQWAIENTLEQPNYTVTTVQDLGLGYDNGGTIEEMYGLDVIQTAKFDKASDMFSESEVTSMPLDEGQTYIVNSEQSYGVLDGTTAYVYRANGYGTEAEYWLENVYFKDNDSPDNDFIHLAAGVAFETLMNPYNCAGASSATLTSNEIANCVNYDASSNKLTLSGATAQWTFLVPEYGYLMKEFDAALEVTFENNLVKSYTINLSRAYSYYEIFQSSPDYGEPETVNLYGTITGTVAYGNTQVTIPSADQTSINIVKANRPVANAINALDDDEQNFTMTIHSGATLVGAAKYSVTTAGGVYSLEGNHVDNEYVTVALDGEGNFTHTDYYLDGSSWFKKTASGNGLSGSASFDSINKNFYLGNSSNPDSDSPISLAALYGKFTKGENNTYTATLNNRQYAGWDEDLEQSVYNYVPCNVTIKLDSEGRLSSVEYDYGSNADGDNFKNLKYTFTAYGTTHATVPQSVLDAAKEIGSSEDSVIAQAFDKLRTNTESATVVLRTVNTSDSGYTQTETKTIDVSNGLKKIVHSYNNNGGYTAYYKLAQDGGLYYNYNYELSNGIWTYRKYEAGSDYDNALKNFAQIEIWASYAAVQGGNQTNIQSLYWAFNESADGYTANLYKVYSENEQQIYTPCTVTIKLDGSGRITSLKAESSVEVDEYTITYGSGTVTLPTEVENAKEYLSPDDSEVYKALRKIRWDNTDSLICNYEYGKYINQEYSSSIFVSRNDLVNGYVERINTENGNSETSYRRLVEENGAWYTYDYYSNGEDWTCNKNVYGYGDYEDEIKSFAEVQFLVGNYSVTELGYPSVIEDLYNAFVKSGDSYTADLYNFNGYWDDEIKDLTYEAARCTVTIQIDGEGRLTKIKTEVYNGDNIADVYETTITYGNVTVTIPDEVLAVQP